MILFMNKYCMQCKIIIHKMKQLRLKVELRDTGDSKEAQEQLREASNIFRVPCLVVEGRRPMHNFGEIFVYLHELSEAKGSASVIL